MPRKFKILLVGKACIDYISFITEFPLEGEEKQVIEKTFRPGGNCINSSVVLGSLLKRPECVYLLSNFSTDCSSDDSITYLNRYGVDTTLCPRIDKEIPESFVFCSVTTGSRTIVHNASSFPLLGTSPFLASMEKHAFDWIHFEARNYGENKEHFSETPLLKMLQHVIGLRKKRNSLVISLECEKIRVSKAQSKLLLLIPADIIFISQQFASAFEWKSPEEAVKEAAKLNTYSDFVCTWGATGCACYSSKRQKCTFVEAKKIKVLDTLAAGDTFNASFIYNRLLGKEIEECLEEANALAAKKCQKIGLDNIYA